MHVHTYLASHFINYARTVKLLLRVISRFLQLPLRISLATIPLEYSYIRLCFVALHVFISRMQHLVVHNAIGTAYRNTWLLLL